MRIRAIALLVITMLCMTMLCMAGGLRADAGENTLYMLGVALNQQEGVTGGWTGIGAKGDWKNTVAGTILNDRLYTTETSGALYETDLPSGKWKQIGKPEFGNTAFLFAANNALYTIETIYQAVIEALCQYGRTLPSWNNAQNRFKYITPPFDPNSPLILPVPPGRGGIEILSHPNTVLLRPFTNPTTPQYVYSEYASWDQRFQSPLLDKEGYSLEEPKGRSLPDEIVLHKFRDFFPYQLSADGKRARIGYSYEGDSFDVEVRKIEGRWLPVECRFIEYSGEHSYWHTVTPIRRSQSAR